MQDVKFAISPRLSNCTETPRHEPKPAQPTPGPDAGAKAQAAADLAFAVAGSAPGPVGTFWSAVGVAHNGLSIVDRAISRGLGMTLGEKVEEWVHGPTHVAKGKERALPPVATGQDLLGLALGVANVASVGLAGVLAAQAKQARLASKGLANEQKLATLQKASHATELGKQALVQGQEAVSLGRTANRVDLASTVFSALGLANSADADLPVLAPTTSPAEPSEAGVRPNCFTTKVQG